VQDLLRGVLGLTYVHAVARELEALLLTLGRDGRDFERLAQWFLRSDPEFRARFAEVWLWDEWPDRWGPDNGIDLIARTHDGRLAAIQAKDYNPKYAIKKADVNSFLAESNRKEIAERLLIATTDQLGPSCREVMAQQEKPVSTCLRAGLFASAVTWPASLADLAPAPPPPAEPREHQLEALQKIRAWLADGPDRGQVVMACGTGKSLVGVWAAEHAKARRVLVLAPTLDLLRQLSRVWTQHASTPRMLLHISSDSDRQEDDVTRGDELGSARTTDASQIAAHMSNSPDLLVMCTYNSSGVLADAMRLAGQVEFDLAVVDEAHRCAGALNSTHKTILNPSAIRARRRLFFTATPAVFSTQTRTTALSRNVRVASMDDQEQFGPVVYSLSFAEAIRRKLLCPYQVVVIPIADRDVLELIEDQRFVTVDADRILLAGSLAVQIACARAMRRYGCRRVVAFQAGIARSKRFAGHFPIAASLLPEDERPPLDDLWCEHVDGSSMRPTRRFRLLEQFKTDDRPEQHRILSNVRLLAEGVDVPGIDAVAFVDTRRGHAQIIQAVGRAVRNAPGKTVGTIVLPIVLRDGEPIQRALARTEHRMVVDVLGALRSHDPTVAKSLDTLRYGLSRDHETEPTTGTFIIDAPVEVGTQFADAVRVALAAALGVPTARPEQPAAGTLPRRDPDLVFTVPREPDVQDVFARGLDELSRRARWRLLPAIPASNDGFPLGLWWDGVIEQWQTGAISDEDKAAIADNVSWLDSSLDGTTQQTEMAYLSSFDVPAQVASQFDYGGPLRNGPLGVLLDTGGDHKHLVEPFTAIHASITHPAMSPQSRARFLRRSLDHLANGVKVALNTPAPPSYYWTSQRRIAIESFDYAVRLTAAGPSVFGRPRRPVFYDVGFEAYEVGMAAAEPLVHVVETMRKYAHGASQHEVERRITEEREMHPDQHLDALGWEIYALVRAVHGDISTALSLAMGGTLTQRQAVHRDRHARAVQALRQRDQERPHRRRT
jgi:superfamily II DNA or RNA helicase